MAGIEDLGVDLLKGKKKETEYKWIEYDAASSHPL